SVALTALLLAAIAAERNRARHSLAHASTELDKLMHDLARATTLPANLRPSGWRRTKSES
ncbi:MAG: hypothetical protein ACRDP6_06020, partial [Actinoallomurus sp.]